MRWGSTERMSICLWETPILRGYVSLGRRNKEVRHELAGYYVHMHSGRARADRFEARRGEDGVLSCGICPRPDSDGARCTDHFEGAR